MESSTSHLEFPIPLRSGHDWYAAAPLIIVLAFAAALGCLTAKGCWLAVCAGFAALLLLVRPIHVVVGLYAFLIPFEEKATIAGNGSQDTILRYIGLLAIVLILGVGALQNRLRTPPRTAWMWSGFVVWAIFTSLWCINGEDALARIPTAIGMWLLYLVIVSIRLTSDELSAISMATILGGTAAALYSSYTFFRGGAIARASMSEGLDLSDPNFYAFSLLLPFALAFGMVLSGRGWFRKLVALAATGAITFGIFLTMSRGALVGILVMIVVFLVRLRFSWRNILPLGIALAGIPLMPQSFFDRMHSTTTSRISGRQDIWVVALHSLKSYGFLGAGLDNFGNAYMQYAGTARYFVGQRMASHNIYLTIAVEFGIVGCILVFLAVRLHLSGFSKLLRHSGRPIGLVAFEAGSWGILVAAFSLDVLWRKAFWFTWALSAGALHVAQREAESSRAISRPDLKGIPPGCQSK